MTDIIKCGTTEEQYQAMQDSYDRRHCKHKHTASVGFPTGALICIDCKRLIDPETKQPLQAAVTEHMKADAAKAKEDKETLWG